MIDSQYDNSIPTNTNPETNIKLNKIVWRSYFNNKNLLYNATVSYNQILP